MADNSENKPNTLQPHLDTVPRPGQTYIIRHSVSHRQVTLIEGILCLERHMGDQGGYHWECIETNGWLGFRNPSDHLHIGGEYEFYGPHNEYQQSQNLGETFGRPVAQERSHMKDAYLTVRGHQEGGQILLVKFGDRLLKMAVEDDEHKLCWTDKDGPAWEFVNILAPSHRDT
ncbi:hypothetical protein F5Y04DRAFT_282775 [Hypomontagnella monticulosa]|nr:hypothetical protein F5Y04DRAFT_282775 [Hypomontagnella monticulosa]